VNTAALQQWTYIIAATAANHGLAVLQDDADYRTVARHAPDLTEQSVHDVS
jgi:hypothetical protein